LCAESSGFCDERPTGGYELPADFVQSSDKKWTDADRSLMKRCLELARQAESQGEVPVGAVLMQGGEIAGEGWNRPIAQNDPTAHAEIEALRAAAKRLGNYRLPGSTLYVTLEPCVMCAGAIVIARVERLVFAARDLRFGAVRSKFELADSDRLNHRLRIEEGLLAAEAAALIAKFFSKRRNGSS
jgi:tRNA(adenine34) deaminase